MEDDLLPEIFGICSGIRGQGFANEPHGQGRPDGASKGSVQRAWKRALLPAAAGGRLVAPAETDPDGRQTHAGGSSAERTTDPYINLELMQNFKISAI